MNTNYNIYFLSFTDSKLQAQKQIRRSRVNIEGQGFIIETVEVRTSKHRVRMRQQSVFHRIAADKKGTFLGNNMAISVDGSTWRSVSGLQITARGDVRCSDKTGPPDLAETVLKSLQSCYVQIISNTQQANHLMHQPGRKILARKNGFQNGTTLNDHVDNPPVIFIKTYDNERLYIRVATKQEFVEIIASLVVWQGLKTKGLGKKWYCDNRMRSANNSNKEHEVLVCRFKVYGPIPTKSKNIRVVPGQKAPLLSTNSRGTIDNMMGNGYGNRSNTANGAGDSIEEGWFYTMGVLKSNGILNFITELDGQVLYSIDVKTLLSSEIREIHHSIFDNENVLFLGQIRDLRWNNHTRLTSPSKIQLDTRFLFRDGKPIASNNRVYIEFPLHIDLEDWFVGLNYFAMREYIGTSGLRAQKHSYGIENIESSIENDDAIVSANKLKDDTLRVSKKLKIDIVEAKFDQAFSKGNDKLYAEVVMWGIPWAKTTLVPISVNPFWKEQVDIDLPILSQMVHILIKRTKNSNIYTQNDTTVASVYLTPDVLANHLNIGTSTIMGRETESLNGGMNKVSSLDLVNLTIYDSNNLPIGKLCLNVKLNEFHVLPPKAYKPLEHMLISAPMKDLIAFCNKGLQSSEIEEIGLVMLDVFQGVGVEEQWFKALMELELTNIDIVSRNNYVSKRSSKNGLENQKASTNNVFNTLFRGQSLFTKSLELYILRIGQEYLEKVFSDFFDKIATEAKDCETDPRNIRRQVISKMRAQMRGENGHNSDEDSDDYEFDSEQEKLVEEQTQLIVENNFENLYSYISELWNRIYITSNDLPQQIRSQLKNFRTKVELSCDPDDSKTPLNCLSAFIFLRFFCPAILNPKLFSLTKDHQTGSVQRTHTLLAKVLLNLANRQRFTPHKELHLLKLNSFLDEQEPQVLDYYDKITGRKNDFTEKILDLSHEMKRFDLGLSEDESSLELPTTPYLIDKYLKLTELVYLLDSENGSGLTSKRESIPLEPPKAHLGRDEFDLNAERNVYKIGSLEFEKSDFLDLAGDDDTEDFIKSLCGDNENIFSFITSNITLEDIKKQARSLLGKIQELETHIHDHEYPTNYSTDAKEWDLFCRDVVGRSYLDTSTNTVVQLDLFDLESNPNLKKLTENAFNSLKLKFLDTSLPPASISLSVSSNSLGSVFRSPTKNPLKKLFRKT